MASKGQKFIKVPDDLKRQILKEYYDGKGGTHLLGNDVLNVSFTSTTFHSINS